MELMSRIKLHGNVKLPVKQKESKDDTLDSRNIIEESLFHIVSASRLLLDEAGEEVNEYYKQWQEKFLQRYHCSLIHLNTVDVMAMIRDEFAVALRDILSAQHQRAKDHLARKVVTCKQELQTYFDEKIGHLHKLQSWTSHDAEDKIHRSRVAYKREIQRSVALESHYLKETKRVQEEELKMLVHTAEQVLESALRHTQEAKCKAVKEAHVLRAQLKLCNAGEEERNQAIEKQAKLLNRKKIKTMTAQVTKLQENLLLLKKENAALLSKRDIFEKSNLRFQTENDALGMELTEVKDLLRIAREEIITQTNECNEAKQKMFENSEELLICRHNTKYWEDRVHDAQELELATEKKLELLCSRIEEQEKRLIETEHRNAAIELQLDTSYLEHNGQERQRKLIEFLDANAIAKLEEKYKTQLYEKAKIEIQKEMLQLYINKLHTRVSYEQEHILNVFQMKANVAPTYQQAYRNVVTILKTMFETLDPVDWNSEDVAGLHDTISDQKDMLTAKEDECSSLQRQIIEANKAKQATEYSAKEKDLLLIELTNLCKEKTASYNHLLKQLSSVRAMCTDSKFQSFPSVYGHAKGIPKPRTRTKNARTIQKPRTAGHPSPNQMGIESQFRPLSASQIHAIIPRIASQDEAMLNIERPPTAPSQREHIRSVMKHSPVESNINMNNNPEKSFINENRPKTSGIKVGTRGIQQILNRAR